MAYKSVCTIVTLSSRDSSITDIKANSNRTMSKKRRTPNICCKWVSSSARPLLICGKSFQAATAHSFHLSEDLALQSVTSVPAKSLEIDHRVGYVRAGFDADLVLWDSHPLSTGATAIQVYIDGRATLDPAKVVESLENVPTKDMTSDVAVSRMRPVLSTDVKEKLCAKAHQVGTKIVVTGISTSFLDETSALEESRNLTMVIDNGKIACLDIQQSCASVSADGLTIHLENGFVIPGLTAVTSSLGLAEVRVV